MGSFWPPASSFTTFSKSAAPFTSLQFVLFLVLASHTAALLGGCTVPIHPAMEFFSDMLEGFRWVVSCPRLYIAFQLLVVQVFQELVPKVPVFIGHCVRVVRVKPLGYFSPCPAEVATPPWQFPPNGIGGNTPHLPPGNGWLTWHPISNPESEDHLWLLQTYIPKFKNSEHLDSDWSWGRSWSSSFWCGSTDNIHLGFQHCQFLSESFELLSSVHPCSFPFLFLSLCEELWHQNVRRPKQSMY